MVATPVRESGVGQGLAFATGAVVMVGTAVVVLMLLLELIDRVAPREDEAADLPTPTTPQEPTQ